MLLRKEGSISVDVPVSLVLLVFTSLHVERLSFGALVRRTAVSS